MQRHVISTLGALILFVLASTTAPGMDVPLEYVKHTGRGFSPQGHLRVDNVLQPPEGEWKLPQLHSKLPIYNLVELGDRKHLLVLDRQQPGSPFYNRIYFDANANGDLTDDPAIDGSFNLRGGCCITDFKAIDATVLIDGKSLSYSFMPNVHFHPKSAKTKPVKKSTASKLKRLLGGGDSDTSKNPSDQIEMSQEDLRGNKGFSLRTNCYYKGRFNLEGSDYQVQLGDTDLNGCFGEMKPTIQQNDKIYLAGGNDSIQRNDGQACGDMLMIGDKLFGSKVSTAEGKMTLAPMTEGLGTLDLAAAPERMVLYSTEPEHTVVIYRAGKQIQIPAGQYKLFNYDLRSKDEWGDGWRLLAEATGEFKPVTVASGQPTTLAFGEPYTGRIELNERDIAKVRRGNNSIRLNFNIYGSVGERVAEVLHVSGNQTQIPRASNKPIPPKYRITQADGELVTQGKFEYG